MNNDQIFANQLTGLSPESFDKIRWLLRQSNDDAIVVVQQYGLTAGIDIATWQKTDDNALRTVLATGPVRNLQKFDSLTQIEISDDESIPRSDRIEEALVASEQHTTSAIENSSLEWLINEASTVDLAEFYKVKEIVDSLVDGCESVLGVDSSVWVVYQRDGNLRCISKSWDGNIVFEEYWHEVRQILELVGIFELPIQSA